MYTYIYIYTYIEIYRKAALYFLLCDFSENFLSDFLISLTVFKCKHFRASTPYHRQITTTWECTIGRLLKSTLSLDITESRGLRFWLQIRSAKQWWWWWWWCDGSYIHLYMGTDLYNLSWVSFTHRVESWLFLVLLAKSGGFFFFISYFFQVEISKNVLGYKN